MRTPANPPSTTAPILTPALGLFLLGVAVMLVLARSVHYLLFHTLAELIAISISFSIFILAWASRQHLKNGYLIVLGAAYVTIGTIDLFHALTFKGMNLLPGATTNHPTQFWLAARFVEALALVAAPMFIRRAPSFAWTAWAFAVPGAVACLAVLNGMLPATYLEGVGLTPFKILGEYVIILLLVLAQALLWRRRGDFPPQVFRLLSASLLFAIATEFCFIHYVGFYDFINELGYYFRFLSVVLAYLALVVTGIRRPTEILYRELMRKDAELQQSNEQLHEREDNLKKAQAVAGVGSWHLDIPSQRLSWSDETYRIFGIPIGVPQSFETFVETIHPEDLQRVVTAWNDAVHRQADYDVEHRILVQGEVRWVRERADIARNYAREPLVGIGTVQDVTQQKLAEMALRESEERYRLLYKKTPAIMHSIDADGRLLSVSDLWLKTLGYEREEVLGRQSSDFLTEASRRHAIEKVLPEFFRVGSCADVPYQFVAKDGRILDMLLSAFAERDADGRFVRSMAVMVDVTARNRAEAALTESELRFRGAFETAPHGMALVSTEGRFIKVNPALCAMLGYEETDLLATDFQAITHPDDLVADLESMTDLLAGRIQTYQMEKRYFTRAGNLIWILLSVSLVRGKEGIPLHFVSQIQDITDRKLSQQRLEELLAEQKTMLENDLVGIARVRNRVVTWANPAFEKMLGYAPGELVDMPTRRLFPTVETYESSGAAAQAVLANGNVFRTQIEYVRKDGKMIWVDVNGSLLNRATTESLWGFIDITEHRQLEQKIARSEERMELALAGADMGLWDIDLRIRGFTHNERFLAMLGLAADEVPTDIRAFISTVHPEDAPRFSAAFVAHLQGATPSFEAEYRVLHKDGHWVWILSRGKVVDRDGNGRAVRVAGTNLDISKRKRDEATLIARESRLSALVASMQDIVIVFDTGGTVTEFFRPPVLQLESSRPREEVIGKTYEELLPGHVAALVFDAMTGILTDGLPRTFEYAIEINGKEYIAQSTLSPLRGAGAYPVGFLNVIRDITVKRTAQREFERMARANALLLESVGEGIFGVDIDHRTTFVNPAAVAMLGSSEEELIGREQHGLFHHHHQDGSPYPASECPVRLTLGDGLIRHVENEWYWRKDGSGFPVAMTVTPVIEDDRRVGVVVVFQDISDRKAHEARIHDLAFYDALTRLPNRRLLLDRLGLALPASGRRGAHGAVLFLDLDNFKTLNDTKGHEFGDLLLIEAARRLLGCVRAEDTVARLGGDEFVIMLENLSADARQAGAQVLALAEKIRDALGATYLLQGHAHRCTTSIGVCLFKGPDAGIGELLKRADMAMYRAKAAGRDTIRFFQPD